MYQLEVDADFVATQMYSLICGNNVTNIDKDNKCDINSIAAPDNLSMMRGHNQMIIGEDTEDHQNDVVWLYSFDVSIDSMLNTPALLARKQSFHAVNHLNWVVQLRPLLLLGCNLNTLQKMQSVLFIAIDHFE